MEVLGARLSKEVDMFDREVIIPRTYFLLTSEEQELYKNFRDAHDKIRKLPQGSTTDEQNEGVSKMFLNLVNPYLNTIGLKPYRSFTMFGRTRETMLLMPRYKLSDDENDGNFEFHFLFSTEDENLSCTSNFLYNYRNPYKRRVVNEIFQRRLKGFEQDGVNFPIVFFMGELVEFAPINFSLPLIKSIKTFIDKIGPEKMNELVTLYTSYLEESERESEGYSQSKIKKEVFRMAYASSLEIALLDAKLR